MTKTKKLLSAVFLILTAVMLALSFSVYSASADEHNHYFEKGRCSCGVYRLEGENADMSKTYSADADGKGILLEEVSDASGGWILGNWSVPNNIVEWKFSVNKEFTAPITVALASCGSGTTMSSSHEITVNGVKAEWQDNVVPPIVGQQWYDFKLYKTAPVKFEAGDIKLVLKNISGYPSNIDYLDIAFDETVIVGEHSHECESVCDTCGKCTNFTCNEDACREKCTCEVHYHSFTDGRCACGALKIEAENAAIEGTPAGGDSFIFTDTRASGNAYVGNWGGSADNVMTFSLNVSKAQDVRLGVVFAPRSPGNSWVLPTEGTRDDKGKTLWAFEMRVNTLFDESNEVVLFEKETIPAYNGNEFKWYTSQTQSVHLNEGLNFIQIEEWDYYACNIDCIIVEIDSETTVTFPEVIDLLKPSVELNVLSEVLKEKEEIEFAYTVTDNLTEVENIKVEAKVYLNYGRDNQEEIALTNNKFTPDKAGKYTIVITAEDEAGHKTVVTRALTVKSEQQSVIPVDPDNPGSDDPGSQGSGSGLGDWEPVKGWPLKVFAWWTDWVVLAVFVGVFGLGYFLYAWLFGRMKLSNEEKAEVKTMPKELKAMPKAERKVVVKAKPAHVRRVYGWNTKLRYILTPIVAVLMAIVMIATPILTTTWSMIMEALYPAETLSPDNPATALAIGDAKKNCETIMDEGVVLLKNGDEDGKPVLPLDSAAQPKINIFGASAFGLLYGGGGSGVFVTNATSYGNELYATRLEKALVDEGFEYNKNLYNLVANYYESKKYKITHTDYDIQCQYNAFQGNTYDNAGNLLIKPTCFPYDNEPEASAYNSTYAELNGQTLLQDAKNYSDTALYCVSRAGSEDGDISYELTKLTERERAMINLLKDNFKKVIVLINSSNTMELGELDDDKVDSVLWIGHPGLTGAKSVAGVISGRINPSGKLVDTWIYDNMSSPSSVMFGLEGTAEYSNAAGKPYQVYYEGVYVGYRYFVTRALTDPSFEYDKYVQWSFGEGYSYTTFEKHITEFIADPEEDLVSIQIAVKNTGNVAGKEAVQIYFDTPYTGKYEKPARELGGFAKTDMIEPGDTYYARVEFKFSDMASWDSSYNSGTGAYILEEGDYNISLRENVWDVTPEADENDKFVNTHIVNLKSQKIITADTKTGNALKTSFSDVEYGPNDAKVTYLSRADWEGTFPTEAKINRVASARVRNSRYDYSYTKDNLINTEGKQFKQNANYGLTVADFAGVGLNESATIWGEQYTWDDLVSQMSISDMCKLVDNKFMGTVGIESVGKPETNDDDGPASVSIYGVGYPSEVAVASSWNVQAAYLLGNSLGKEGASMGMTGWFAPGLNIHRSAMGGRNFEYYSEDPLISGYMAAESIKGAAYYGIYTYIKHFVLNDQETDRRTIQVWANEQGMREVYMRAFEIAIKEGGSMGVMSAFNFLGTTWCGASKALLTDVLRGEWGFEGVVVTDWVNPSTMVVNAGLRAGNDLWLGKNTVYSAMNAYNETPNDVQLLLRESCKRILYAIANSNAVWTDEQFKAVGIDKNVKY